MEDIILDSEEEACPGLEVVPDSEDDAIATTRPLRYVKSPVSSIVIMSDEDVPAEELRLSLSTQLTHSESVLVLSDSEDEVKKSLVAPEPVSVSPSPNQAYVNSIVSNYIQVHSRAETDVDSLASDWVEETPADTFRRGLRSFAYSAERGGLPMKAEGSGMSMKTEGSGLPPAVTAGKGKNSRRKPKPVVEKLVSNEKLAVLSSCPFCLASWTTTAPPASKLEHVKTCANRHGTTDCKTIKRKVDDYLLRLSRDELKRRTREDQTRSLFDKAIGRGEGPSKNVRIVGVEDSSLADFYSEIEQLRKRAGPSKLNRIAQRIMESRAHEDEHSEAEEYFSAEDSSSDDEVVFSSPLEDLKSTQPLAPSSIAEKRLNKGFEVVHIPHKPDQSVSNGASLWSAAAGQPSARPVNSSSNRVPMSVDPPLYSHDIDVQLVKDLGTLVLDDSDETSSTNGQADLTTQAWNAYPLDAFDATYDDINDDNSYMLYWDGTEDQPSRDSGNLLSHTSGDSEVPSDEDGMSLLTGGSQVHVTQKMPEFSKMKVAELRLLVINAGHKPERQKQQLVEQMRRITLGLSPISSDHRSDKSKRPSPPLIVERLTQPVPDDLDHELVQLIKKDIHLYRRILSYEPISFEELYAFVKDGNIKITHPALLKWLDSKSVTYYKAQSKRRR